MLQALEEAEHELQKERTELITHLKSQSILKLDPVVDSDESQEQNEEERLFKVQQDCRMASIIQGALNKREEVITLLAKR